MLPALLACFGLLVSAHGLPPGSCPVPDPFEYAVLLPNPKDCSSFFICSNGVPIKLNCPAGLHFNDQLKVCDWPQNANCVRGELCSLCLTLDFVNFSDNDSINQSLTEILRTLFDQFKQKLISEILIKNCDFFVEKILTPNVNASGSNKWKTTLTRKLRAC
jgi:hypothetical protein